jgi:hypothetical protein
MNKQQGIEFKLRPALQECWLHRTQLHAAWQEAINFPAIKYLAIQELNDAEVRTLDQLVFRFGKLQDAIESRLLPAILRILQKRQENDAFLDKPSRTKKIGMLPSIRYWLFWQQLHNPTAYRYSGKPEIVPSIFGAS